MKILINEVLHDKTEAEILDIASLDTVTIPDDEGVFCMSCQYPVKFTERNDLCLGGRCNNCNKIIMQKRSSTQVPWNYAAIFLYPENSMTRLLFSLEEIVA